MILFRDEVYRTQEAQKQEERVEAGKKAQELANEIAANLESLSDGSFRSDRSI